MTNLSVKTVRDYLASGLAAVLARYRRGDYDEVMNNVVLPGLIEILCTSTGKGRISGMAGEYRALFREHPEAVKELVAMSVSLGIGMAALEEIR